MSGNTATSKLPDCTPIFRGAIVGVSGSGKGNAAKAWVARQQKRKVRLVAFDADDEYSVLGKARPGYVHLGTLKQRVRVSDLLSDPRCLDRADLALSVVPDDDDDAAAEQCAEFSAVIKATGDLTVVYDEIGGYAFENASAHLAKKALNTIATKARKDGVAALFVSQRLVHIPASARAALTAIEVFHQDAPLDLKALEELTGQPDLSRRVASLPPGESILWLSKMLNAGTPAKDDER